MLSVAITDKILASPSFKVHLALVVLKELLTALTKVLLFTSELVLALLTLGGPILILVQVLAVNVYLMIKPVVHALHPSVTYKQAFAQARKDVCRFFMLHGKVFHRYSVEGFDKIPTKGGAVIVYYHGAIPIDYAFLVASTVLEKNRIVLSIIDKCMIWTPGFEMLSAGLGCFAGTRKDCIRLLKAGRLIGIAPGGGLEAQCASSDTYEVLWKQRSGFAAIAKEAGVPIIPFFTENIRESVVNMQSGQTWWRKLYEWTRIPATPLYGGFPVRLTTHIGDPIYPNDDTSVEDLRNATVAAMEGLIKQHQTLPGDVLRSVRERIQIERSLISQSFLQQSNNGQEHLEDVTTDSEQDSDLSDDETDDCEVATLPTTAQEPEDVIDTLRVRRRKETTHECRISATTAFPFNHFGSHGFPVKESISA